jgi:hypothetical protein
MRSNERDEIHTEIGVDAALVFLLLILHQAATRNWVVPASFCGSPRALTIPI